MSEPLKMELEEATAFFAKFYFGEHHIPQPIKRYGLGWYVVNFGSSVASFDFDEMTRLVFLAHDHCIRVEVGAMSGGKLRIAIHKREGRDGHMARRHPDLQHVIEQWRKSHPLLSDSGQ